MHPEKDSLQGCSPVQKGCGESLTQRAHLHGRVSVREGGGIKSVAAHH